MANRKTAGIIGWRGMVGSVLMERMRAEGDFELVDPVFFTTSNVGGAGPDIGRPTGPLKDANDIAELAKNDDPHHLPGRRLHEGRLPEAARGRLEGLLDRRGLGAAHGEGRRHHPRPGEPPGHRPRARRRREELHRRQLHREPHAHGDRRAAQGGPGRVDERHDLPGGLGRRRAEHARAPAADGRGALRRQGAARRPGVGDPRHRPGGRGDRCATRSSRRPTSACRWPAASCRGSTPTSETARAGRSGRGTPRRTRSSAANPRPVAVDGLCVRVGAMRCHSQGLTIKLRKDLPARRDRVRCSPKANDWVRVVPEPTPETLERLTPAAVTGTLEVPIGRLRKLRMGGEYLVRVHGRRPAPLGCGGAAPAHAADRLRGA